MRKIRCADKGQARARAIGEISGLVIGVDGGGTKTAARIASVADDGRIHVLGAGYGGPSNVRTVGSVHAKTNLDVAIDAAHEAAGTRDFEVGYAVLALAGSALPDVQADIADWATRRGLAAKVDIVHDAEPILVIAARRGRGVGLIVGTGSVAIGRDADGRQAVIGGWGHWFGDQGSGFDLGRRALAAVADAVDGIGGETSLTEELAARVQVAHPREIARKLSLAVDARREIAALAPIVVEAARNGDDVAKRIVDGAAAATADLVVATIGKLALGNDAPLGLAGGVVCSGDFYRGRLLARLESLGVRPDPVTVVAQPVEGSLVMARDRLRAGTAS